MCLIAFPYGLVLSFVAFAWKKCQFFFTHAAHKSNNPSLLPFLLVQQLFCFIAWSQQLMPLIHSCIHKQPQKVTMSSNTNISSFSYHRSWRFFSGRHFKLTAATRNISKEKYPRSNGFISRFIEKKKKKKKSLPQKNNKKP